MFTYTFPQILTFFMFYAFVGWCLEVMYHAVTTGHFINRGVLNGPVCPIYGVGAVIVILALTPLSDNLLILYAGSVILTSALEFVTGFVLEKIFHQRWWDYTDEPFNIMGYVCLRFSLMWGFGCVFIMRLIQPFVLHLFAIIPMVPRNIIFITFYALFAADLVITAVELGKIRAKLLLANDIDHLLNHIAENIGERLTAGTLKGEKVLDEQKEHFEAARSKAEARASSIEERYEKLREKSRAERAEKLSAVHRRLEKAYPSLDLNRMRQGNMSEKLKGLRERLDELRENAASGSRDNTPKE